MVRLGIRVSVMLMLLMGGGALLARQVGAAEAMPILRVVDWEKGMQVYGLDLQSGLTVRGVDPELLAHVDPYVPSPDGQWKASFEYDGQESWRWTVVSITGDVSYPLGVTDNVQQSAWSGESRYFAYFDDEDKLSIIDVDGGAIQKIMGDIGYIAPSPDGHWLGFLHRVNLDIRFYLMPFAADGELQQIPRLPEQWVWSGGMQWSPDSHSFVLFAYAGEQNNIFLFDTESNLAPQRLTDTSSIFQNFPAWSPDGKYLAFIVGKLDALTYTAPEELFVTTVSTGDSKRLIIQQPGAQPLIRAWSPNGRWLAYQTENSLFLYDVQTEETEKWDDLRYPSNVFRDAEAGALLWSADSNWLAFNSSNSTRWDIFVLNLPSRKVYPISDKHILNGWYESAGTLLEERQALIANRP
jgi:Tol biopolymer transport system component